MLINVALTDTCKSMTEKDRIYKKVKSIIRKDGKKSSYIGEDDFVSLSKDGIKINFQNKNSALDIQNLFRVVKRAQKIFNDKFDYALETIEIDIYSSLSEMRSEGKSKSRYASWIAGIYDGKIRLISGQDDEDPNAIYILLTHEIVHLGICEMASGRCPYWLDEGLAIYLSQELSVTYMERLRKALKEEKILPLDILENSSVAEMEEPLRQLVYSQVFSITDYLVQSYGWEKVMSVTQQVRRRPIKTILSDFGLNYYLVEQGWKRWLRNNIA